VHHSGNSGSALDMSSVSVAMVWDEWFMNYPCGGYTQTHIELMSYLVSELPLVVHVVANDIAGMLFAAGSLSASFELNALLAVEVWSCSGLGCVVMSTLLTICEGLLGGVDMKYQLDPADPVHRMIMDQFLVVIRDLVEHIPPRVVSTQLVCGGIPGLQYVEFLSVLTCAVLLAMVPVIPHHLQTTVERAVMLFLLLLTFLGWRRLRYSGRHCVALLARYVCESDMEHYQSGTILIPTTPVVVPGGSSDSAAGAPLVILTNAIVMPTMDRRTTQYQRLTSLRHGVQLAIGQEATSAMALDQLLVGPLNAFYTYNRMPLRCHGGQTLLLIDGWSLSPSYCATHTPVHAHKRMEDDTAILSGAPDTHFETIRLYTTRPIAMIDPVYTVDDTYGHNLRLLYDQIHDMDVDHQDIDDALTCDLLNWGYMAVCAMAGRKLVGSASSAGDINYTEQKDATAPSLAVPYKTSGSEYGPRHQCDTERSTLEGVMDRRPFQTAQYFNVHQFL
jgi:hypothetical protein